MNEAGEQVWQLFCSGKYSDDEIVAMLRLSDFKGGVRPAS